MTNKMTSARINIRSVTNAATRKEVRNGREVVVIPSATLPDDIVMNGIKYPSDEIEKGYKTLERTPAPLGHPTINGRFVSASDPEGINIGYIGAWNENVRRVNGRVLLDKVIDVEVANRTQGGKDVLAAVNEGKPIHTSTGLLCKLEEVQNADGYNSVAREMYFDHDAILLNEDGAATPDQGVGMLVNGEQIKVINSAIDMAQSRLDWAGMDMLNALEMVERASLWEKIKTAIMGAISKSDPEVNNDGKDAPVTDKPHYEALNQQIIEMSAAIKALTESIPTMVSNAVKPLNEHIEKLANEAKQKAEADRMVLVNKVVKANLLSEEVAKTLNVEALNELCKKVADEPKAAALNAAFFGTQANGGDEFASYDPNKAMEVK